MTLFFYFLLIAFHKHPCFHSYSHSERSHLRPFHSLSSGFEVGSLWPLETPPNLSPSEATGASLRGSSLSFSEFVPLKADVSLLGLSLRSRTHHPLLHFPLPILCHLEVSVSLTESLSSLRSCIWVPWSLDEGWRDEYKLSHNLFTLFGCSQMSKAIAGLLGIS